MKGRIAALLGSFLLTLTALAGPEPIEVKNSKAMVAPAPEPRLWQGFYIGINGGYVSMDTDVSDLDFLNAGPPVQSFSYDPSGAVGGGQVGFNWQPLHWLVLGVEGDGGYLGADGRKMQPNSPAPGTFAETEPGAYATARGRIGLAFDRVLLYATGGWFGSDYEREINDTTICNCGFQLGSGENEDWRSGYAVGGGLEWLFRDHWSLRVEYLYFNVGDGTVNVPIVQSGTFRFGFDEDGYLVRGGLNFKF